MSGGTPEAEELALYLRELTDGFTTRALEEEFGQGRTQWSEFRKGTKLIPLWLLQNVVKKQVTGPLREAKFQQGRELLEAAEAAATRARAARRPAGSQAELQLRLDDARKAQIEAQQMLMNTNQLVITLLEMVASLQSRCARLEHERDQALAAHSGSAPSIGEEIAATEQRIVAAEERLQRARHEREEAEDLRVVAHQRAEEHRIALAEKQRAQDPDVQTQGGDPAEAAHPLWEYDRVLEAADDQLDAHRREIDRLWEEVGVSDPQEAATQQVISGEVVRQDNADNVPSHTGIGQQPGQDSDSHQGGAAPGQPLQVFDAHRREMDRLWDEAGTRAPQEKERKPQAANGTVVHDGSADNPPPRQEGQPLSAQYLLDTQQDPELFRAVASPGRDASQVREQALRRSPAQFVELYTRVSEDEQAVMRAALEERSSGDRVAITILLRDAIHQHLRLPPRPHPRPQDRPANAAVLTPDIEVRCFVCAQPARTSRDQLLQHRSWSCTQCGTINKLPG
ncbi:hypothetical protein ACIRU8_44995 [Streptomyces sp. NPDC101175]|uniref:hypothetical protein n=1 Tax=Streptomyces sp. NPDC101175 TaxID=3366123 RepID=UPI003833591A